MNNTIGTTLNLLEGFLGQHIVRWVGLGFNYATNTGSMVAAIYRHHGNRRILEKLQNDHQSTVEEVYPRFAQQIILKYSLAVKLNLLMNSNVLGTLIWISNLLAENDIDTQQEQRIAIVLALLMFSLNHSFAMYILRKDRLALQRVHREQIGILQRMDNIPTFDDDISLGAYRQQLLNELNALFLEEKKNIPVLIGMEGIGKPQLACHYARKFSGDRYVDQGKLQARYFSIDPETTLTQQYQSLQAGLMLLTRLLKDKTSPELQAEWHIYHRILALNLAVRGQPAEAEQLLIESRNQGDMLNRSICNYFLADLYLRFKRFSDASASIQEAIQILEKTKKDDWRLADYHQRYAKILEEMGHLGQAEAAWKNAIACTPKHKCAATLEHFAAFMQRHPEVLQSQNSLLVRSTFEPHSVPTSRESNFTFSIDTFFYSPRSAEVIELGGLDGEQKQTAAPDLSTSAKTIFPIAPNTGVRP